MVKQALKIVLSPFVFFIYFIGLIVIPIGIIALICGLVTGVYNWIMNKEYERDDWFFTFTLFIVPVLATKAFIEGESSEKI